MKILTTLLILALAIGNILAQAPQAFNYQAVIRDSDGGLVVNTNVSIKISILTGSTEGNEVFSETHSLETSEVGSIALYIGNGTVLNGDFENIAWGDGIYFIQTAIDLNNGIDFEIITTSQLLSVPFALHANTTNDKIWDKSDSNIHYNSGNVGINNSDPTTDLDIIGDGTGEDIIAIRNNNYARYAAYGASANPLEIPAFIGFKSRGSVSSPVNLNNQDRVTGLYGAMYIDDKYRVSSAVEIYAGDNVGTGSYPAYMIFGTTPENGTSRMERMRITEDGNIGIGTQTPDSKLQIKSGDIYLEDLNSGVILKSPDENCWRLSVDNSGSLISTSTVCPEDE